MILGSSSSCLLKSKVYFQQHFSIRNVMWSNCVSTIAWFLSCLPCLRNDPHHGATNGARCPRSELHQDAAEGAEVTRSRHRHTRVRHGSLTVVTKLAEGQVRVCCNFQRGQCRYGKGCKYAHIPLPPSSEAPLMNVPLTPAPPTLPDAMSESPPMTPTARCQQFWPDTPSPTGR